MLQSPEPPGRAPVTVRKCPQCLLASCRQVHVCFIADDVPYQLRPYVTPMSYAGPVSCQDPTEEPETDERPVTSPRNRAWPEAYFGAQGCKPQLTIPLLHPVQEGLNQKKKKKKDSLGDRWQTPVWHCSLREEAERGLSSVLRD